ncbi:flavin reductase family protein [Herbaspirillum lusitanum]|uniref:flavin reductase family protein n=1 Tax=Herbaspirillum lusitanum TaxID=213312 RepID=UPI0002FDBFD4|nr:flavin reductase family protein [Herbaspirillum lusitanum]
MYLDFSQVDPRQAYSWLASAVIPRPVAWVSTVSAAGVSNLAPFSFFQMITGKPPTVMISPLVQREPGRLRHGRRHERNFFFVRRRRQRIRTLRHCCSSLDAGAAGEVNLVGFDMADAMNETSFSYDADVSEFERCGIAAAPSTLVRPARVAAAPVSLECELVSCTPYPADAPSCHILLGRVLAAHFDESILNDKQLPDPVKLNLLARMGGDWYGRTRSDANFALSRPRGWEK